MKEDLTIWHIHGLELPLDIEEADTVEKYEAALAQLEQDVPEDKSAGAAAYIRAYCKAFRTFYDTLFGEGTAEQIFSGIHSCEPPCEPLTAVFHSVDISAKKTSEFVASMLVDNSCAMCHNKIRPQL